MDLERRLRELYASGDLAGVATLALQKYGPEIMGLLCTLHPSEADASEAFSSFTLDLWRGLPGFVWASSLRTWAYTLARNASARHGKARAARGRRERLPSDPAALFEVEARVRTETLPFLRTEAQDRVRALREALSEDDRVLLVLRVDRGLDFKEIARVIGDLPQTTDEATLARDAARLRKRFQGIKEKLRRAGREAGLLDDSGTKG